MKEGKFAKNAIALAACSLAMPSMALAKDTTKINRPENVELFSSVGDPMVRITLKESLPNAFGGADIFGRSRDRGYVQITFAGIRDGKVIFWRKSMDVVSNETTMSRSGTDSFNGSATTFGNTTTYSGTINHAPQASVATLPPDTMELALDLNRGHVLTVEDRVINIVSADASGVKFVMTSTKTK